MPDPSVVLVEPLCQDKAALRSAYRKEDVILTLAKSFTALFGLLLGFGFARLLSSLSAVSRGGQHVADYDPASTVAMYAQPMQPARTASLRQPAWPSVMRAASQSQVGLLRASTMTKEVTKEELLDMSFSFGASKLPHPDKIWTGGDDVFFVDKGIRALGVADGVSWWRKQGVDPGTFPKELMSRLKDVIKDRKAGKHPNINTLADALAYAHDATKATGSATVCVALLNPVTSAVHVLNVGDSGLWVLRRSGRSQGWRVVWKAPQQRIQTNMPFQLSSERDVTSKAGDGALQEVKLKPGDLLVAASDGLWDNLHEQEMLNILDKLTEGRGAEEALPEKAAQKLAAIAREHSLDPKYFSPNGLGGKPDDITVVAALATPSSKKPSAASIQLSALIERIRAREKTGGGTKML